MVKSSAGLGAALWRGTAQVGRAWRSLLLAQVWNIALTLCLAVFIQDAIRSSLGSSLAGERMKAGWDSLWYGSFSAQAQGVASTFRPTVSGAGAVLDALDTFLDGFAVVFSGGPESNLWPLLLLYLVSWTFLSGGFVSLFVRPGRGAGFLSRAARLFPTFLLVAVVGLLGYAAILGPMRSWADGFVAARLRDVIDERIQFGWTLAESVLLWSLLLLINLAVDYTKVFAARAEEGHSAFRGALGALGQSGRFVLGHFLPAVGMYLATGFMGLLGLALYVAIVPGAGTSSTAAILGAFVLGQVCVLFRLALRCLFYASEAQFVAGLLPDSPRPMA